MLKVPPAAAWGRESFRPEPARRHPALALRTAGTGTVPVPVPVPVLVPVPVFPVTSLPSRLPVPVVPVPVPAERGRVSFIVHLYGMITLNQSGTSDTVRGNEK
jgi:hypothetical protein